MVGGVLVEVHSPGSTAGETSIAWATHVAVAAINFDSWGLVCAEATLPVLKTGISKSGRIAGNDASERSKAI